MADQSTDLSANQQPEGTTRIENGIAYDISGKPLGPANVPDEQKAPAALAPPPGFKQLAPPPGFKTSQETLPPPPGFKTATLEQPQASVPEEGGAYQSLKNFAGAFNLTLTGSENLDDLKKKVSDFVQAQPPDWAKNLSPELQGWAKLGNALVGMGQGMYAAQKHETEAGIAQMHQPSILNKVSGAVRYAQGGIPVLGPMLGAIEDNFSNGDYAKGLGAAAAMLIPGAAEHYGPALIENAKEVVGRVAVSDTKRLIDATKAHDAAKTLYDGRAKEQAVAAQQAKDAFSAAEQAREAEVAGTGTRQQTIDAENAASAARANLTKAQSALEEAKEAHAISAAKVDQATLKAQRSLVRAATKAKKVVTPEQIEKSNQDFKNAIPPAPGKSAYTSKDLAAVRPILEEAHSKAPVDSPEAVVDALESNRVARDNQVKAAVDKYANEPIKVVDNNGNQVSVKAKLVEALAEDEKVRPGFTEEALQQLDRFNTTDMSVSEADALRQTLNTETRDKLNTPGGWRNVADARETDPAFAALYELQDILRDGVYGTLEDKGVKGARESRNLDASAIRVRNAALRQLTKPGTKMRGTGEAGPIRKGAAKIIQKVAPGVGAAIGIGTDIPLGGEAGAVVGGVVGNKIAKVLAPGDLTRSEQIARSMSVQHGGTIPTIDMSGSIPSNPPATGLPPEVSPPINPRENTELHAALAAHYDEQIGDSSYDELEQRLLEDIAIKKKHGVPVDPAEKKLNLEINKAKVEEIQRARGQHEEQVKAAETAAKEAEAKKEEKAAQGLVTATHPPFETTEHLPVPARYAEMGYTPQRVGVHELAHQIMVDEYGHGTGDIINHHHDQIDPGSLAEARWEKPNFMDEDGKVKPEKIPEILAILHAGVVGEELVHNIPLHENPADDIEIARKIVKDAGFSPAEAGMIMKAAEMKAREVLTAPGVIDIIKRYTEHRQAGLDKDTHMSAETVGQAVQEVRHARGKNAKTDNEARVGKENKTGPSGNESGGEGAAKGEPKKPVQPAGKGGAAAGAAGGEEPRTNLKSVSGAKFRNREESGGVGVAERLTQGGHAGGGVASEEELARPGRFVKISRSGIPTDQGKVPDFNLAAGEAGYQVKPSGEYELKAGQETPATKRGVEGYSREVFPRTNINVPPERTTGSPETDAAIKEGGGIPGGIFGEPNGPHVKMFHAPETGTTLGFAHNEPVTAEATRAKIAESNRKFKVGDAINKAVESKGGFTFNPKTGETPTEGFMAETHPEARQDLGHPPTAEDIRNFIDKNQALLDSHPELHVGGYGNELNVSGHYKTQEAAENAGKKLDQISIYDLKNGKEIPTGGKGKQTQFPDYTTEQRHADLNTAPEIKTNLKPKELIDKAVKNYGLTDEPNKMGWLLPDGRGLDFSDGTASRKLDHGDIASVYGSGELGNENPRERFAKDTAAVRITHSPNWLGVQISHPITREQADGLLSALHEGGKTRTLAIDGITDNGTWGSAQRERGTVEDAGDIQKLANEALGDARKRERARGLTTNLRPKGSTVPLMENPLPVKGTMKGDEVGTLDIVKALNKFSRKSNPALEPGSEPKKMVARAKKIAEDEAKYQLAQSKTGTEWYTTEMKDHDKVLQGLRPELAQGDTVDSPEAPEHPVNLTLFKAAEAILSSGQKPYANVKSALKAWDIYNETGEFPPTNPAPGKEGKSWGPRNVAAYSRAFDSLNRLIKEKGEKGAADWLLSEHPVSELKKYNEMGVSGKKDDMKPGAMILGEKRGPFMQNLHGIESKFTADMWVSRTWNRWMGTLDTDPRIGKEGEMTSESDSPRNNTERALMKESFEKAAKKLNLTTSSLQAVLWYYEQALYRAHGIPVESWSFSDAAKRVAKEANEVPEAEQTGFNFGENEGKDKEHPGIAALAKGSTPKFDALGRPYGRPDLNPK